MSENPRLAISPGEHLCAIYDGEDDRDRILGTYLRDGLAAHDKCMFGASDTTRHDLLRRLDDTGELGAAEASGQLELYLLGDRAFRPDEFSISGVLDYWAGATARAREQGYGFVRLGAEAMWWAGQVPDHDTFIRYETELNIFAPTAPQSILCMYDVRRSDGAFIVNAMRVHPRVMVYGLVIDNPYYLPPGAA